MTTYALSDIGPIPNHWSVVSLDRAVSNYVDNRGKTVPVTDRRTDMVLIATNCIKEDSIYPTKDKVRYVPDDVYRSWFRGHPEPGDIIIVNKGTPGLVCLVPDRVDFCIAQDMVALRADSRVFNNKFLFAYMRSRSFKWQVRALNVGTTIPHLKKTNFRELLIPRPPLEEQEAIADVYFSLSNKIELLLRQNETLEKIAHAIFHEWFIEFNFPDKNGKPYKASGGKMVDSELGPIPEGWRVKPLSGIADFLNGLALQKYPPRANQGTLPVVKIRELQSGITEQTDRCSDDLDQKYIVDDGDVIFSWSGSLELVVWRYGRGALNQHLFKVTSTTYPKWFYLYWVQHHLPWFRLIAASKATTMGHIQRHHLGEATVAIPGETLMATADRLLTPITNKQISNNAQIRTLSNLRDLLLPKLMSGQIRVPCYE